MAKHVTLCSRRDDNLNGTSFYDDPLDTSARVTDIVKRGTVTTVSAL